MIDQATINVGRDHVILLRPDVMNDLAGFRLHGLLRLAGIGTNENTDFSDAEMPLRMTRRVRVFSDRILEVVVMEQGQSGGQPLYRVVKVDLNFPKLLYRHNGVPCFDEDDLCLALETARYSLAGLLVNPAEASLLIPGLTTPSSSYFSKMEVAVNIVDPDFAVMRGMSSMKLPQIRLLPLFVRNETITLQGERLKLSAYRKNLKMRKDFGSRCLPSDPVTRLEATFRFNNFNDVTGAFGSLRVERIDKKLRVVGAKWEDLIGIHRQHFSSLRAVYQSKVAAGVPRESKTAAFIANVSRHFDEPHTLVLETYFDTVPCSPATKSDMRKLVAEHLERSSVLSADEILSDAAYRNQPIIGVSGLPPSPAQYFEIDAPGADIVRAYGTPGRFVPSPWLFYQKSSHSL